MRESSNFETCFICQKVYDPDEVRDQNASFLGRDRCPRCGWGGGSETASEDPRFLVLLSLVSRVFEDFDQLDKDYQGLKLRVQATDREFAVLEHGDQCIQEKLFWRISAKTNGLFWLRCSYLKKFALRTRVDQKRNAALARRLLKSRGEDIDD